MRTTYSIANLTRHDLELGMSPQKGKIRLVICCVSKKGPILLANYKSLSFSTLMFGPAQERLD
jgi:hypothetical protein